MHLDVKYITALDTKTCLCTGRVLLEQVRRSIMAANKCLMKFPQLFFDSARDSYPCKWQLFPLVNNIFFIVGCKSGIAAESPIYFSIVVMLHLPTKSSSVIYGMMRSTLFRFAVGEEQGRATMVKEVKRAKEKF